jgi:hypothetical protein
MEETEEGRAEWYAWLDSVGALGEDPPRDCWDADGRYIPRDAA